MTGFEQADAVLAEDGRVVFIYRYRADDSGDVAAVTMPIVIEEENFLRTEWERGGVVASKSGGLA
ncbi:hypothetical protein I5535_11410 [Rhodobacteraceae bacterium F11138]|nr:hypothetical protein [Rhodobacteraceae bacterium F11138]